MTTKKKPVNLEEKEIIEGVRNELVSKIATTAATLFDVLLKKEKNKEKTMTAIRRYVALEQAIDALDGKGAEQAQMEIEEIQMEVVRLSDSKACFADLCLLFRFAKVSNFGCDLSENKKVSPPEKRYLSAASDRDLLGVLNLLMSN